MRKLKRMIAICLAAVMVLTVCPQQVQAASYKFWSYGPLQTFSYYGSSSWLNLIENGNAKITKVTIVNKSIARVAVNKDKKGITVYPKKAGTTTLKVSVKNGTKTKTHSLKLKIYNYKNPLSTFKIGSTKYTSKYNSSGFYSVSKPKKTKTVKLEVKAKKGYEITSIKYTYNKSNGTTATKELKNGKNFKLYNKTGYVQVTYKNKSTGYTSSISLHYN